MKRVVWKFTSAFIVIAMLVVLSISVAFATGVSIVGSGASFPYEIYKAWIYLYNKEGHRFSYESIGSGGGINQITGKVTDFGGTDAPLTDDELKKFDLIQFPTIVGGVVPVVNIHGIKSGELKLSGEVLARIFSGNITKWSAPEIVSLNPDLKLPDAKIVLVYRADSSGTTNSFTSYLASVDNDFASKVGVGKTVNWPNGVGGKQNDGVAAAVSVNSNSIGYVEYSYVVAGEKSGKFAAIKLQNNDGEFVSPTSAGIANALGSLDWVQTERGWTVDLGKMFKQIKGVDSWPITISTFVLMRNDLDIEKNKELASFFAWVFQPKNDAIDEKVGFVPLPQDLRSKIIDLFKSKGYLQ